MTTVSVDRINLNVSDTETNVLFYFNADYPEYVNSEGSEEPMCEQCICKKRNIDGVLSLVKGHPHLRKLELECKEEY